MCAFCFRIRTRWRFSWQLRFQCPFAAVFGVWRVADARVDPRAVVQDAAGVGEGLEAPVPVVLTHPGVADGVARNTVAKALRHLAEDGLVEIVPSWGTFRTRT